MHYQHLFLFLLCSSRVLGATHDCASDGSGKCQDRDDAATLLQSRAFVENMQVHNGVPPTANMQHTMEVNLLDISQMDDTTKVYSSQLERTIPQCEKANAKNPLDCQQFMDLSPAAMSTGDMTKGLINYIPARASMSSTMKMAVQFPLYGVDTDGNGNDCAPANVPGGCANGVKLFSSLVSHKAGNGKVVVPCGECWEWAPTGLTQDVDLNGLEVRGHLEIKDPGAGHQVKIKTPYVLVTGHMKIESASSTGLLGKVIFHLFKGTELTYLREGCGSSLNCAIPIGHSAFAVIGGSVHFNGFPGGSKSWKRLRTTANPKATQIKVEGDLRDWPIGGDIIVTSTEFGALTKPESTYIKEAYTDQTEHRTITHIKYESGSDTSTLTLNRKLKYSHWGEVLDILGYGKAWQVRAEVALLSRQIVIEGPTKRDLAKGDAVNSHGGHFGVFFTRTPQHIEGVEFRRMGQQGTFGRYPLHMHMSQDHTNSKILKNSVWESRLRCYVVHGTTNLLLQENVAYNTAGHCFFLEDGYEKGTILLDNLVAVVFPPKDQPGLDPEDKGFYKNLEDDYTASGYWITHSDINMTGNVATGVCTCENCDSAIHKCSMCIREPAPGAYKPPPFSHSNIFTCSGVWFTMQKNPRRSSGFYADAAQSNPTHGQPPLKKMFTNNVMHGNHIGFKYYRPGWTPDHVIHERNNTFYKNNKGVFNHKNIHFDFEKYLFLDNREAINTDQSDDMTLHQSAIVGVSRLTTDTVGSYCAVNPFCTGCPDEPRAMQWDGHYYQPTARGIANKLQGVTFSGFDQTCRTEDGTVVTPISIRVSKESNNAQDWVEEVLDGITVSPKSTKLVWFDPFGNLKGKNDGKTDLLPKSYATLVGTKDASYLTSWTLRHRHWRVHNIPDSDPDSSGTERWWLPSNHWQRSFLGMHAPPTYEICTKQEGTSSLTTLAINPPWAQNQAPTDLPEQMLQCSDKCNTHDYFAVRRQVNNDPKSAQCLCVSQSEFAEAKKALFSVTPDCDSRDWWSVANAAGTLIKNDFYNAIYSHTTASVKTANPGQCKEPIRGAQNLMSCPSTNLCFRTVRFSFNWGASTKGDETDLQPAAVKFEHLGQRGSAPLVPSGWSNTQFAGKFTTSVHMWKYNDNALDGPDEMLAASGKIKLVGTGTLSVAAGNAYKVQFLVPNSNADDWVTTRPNLLKIELFDARTDAVAGTWTSEEKCKLHLEIESPTGMPWTTAHVPTGCTLSKDSLTVVCTNFHKKSLVLKDPNWLGTFNNRHTTTISPR